MSVEDMVCRRDTPMKERRLRLEAGGEATTTAMAGAVVELFTNALSFPGCDVGLPGEGVRLSIFGAVRDGPAPL
jgi:hypothetical protein